MPDLIKQRCPFRPLLLSIGSILAVAYCVKMLSALGYGITYAVTASMPNGFYLLLPPKNLHRYDIVEFHPPPSDLIFLHQHNLIPKNGRLIKYVFAIPHDKICRENRTILVNGKKIGNVFAKTTAGVQLPQYAFCGSLGEKQYFLLSNKVPNSFDSRYFGPIMEHDIISKAVPLFRLTTPAQTQIHN
jgi:conjugative transfer signal peptidase TraF